jgi:hypothetical protein
VTASHGGDSLNTGYEMPEQRAEMFRALGRIEEAINFMRASQDDIRLDLQSMATVQEKATARTMALEMRVESLERWQMIHNERCVVDNSAKKDRKRLIGGTAAILLIPTITWIGNVVTHVNELMDRIDKHVPK